MVTNEQKIAMYENFLHNLQLYAEVTMNGERVGQLISNACNWSYAHRSGNGEYTEEEQQEVIEEAFWKLCDVK